MISIVTVNYNGLDITLQLLKSLGEVNFSGEIIIVDNGSDMNEAEIFRELYPGITVVRSEQNLGFAGGNNLGIKHAKGSLVLFLNNDTTVKENFEIAVEEFFTKHPRVGAMSPKILFEQTPNTIQYAGYTKLSPVTMRNKVIGHKQIDSHQYHSCPTAYTHGAAMVVRAETIKEVGAMPEDYFLYYEELDWCEMIRRRGWEIWYFSGMTVYHKESWTTGRNSPMKTYYLTRNRLIFAKRNIEGLRGHISRYYQIYVAAPLNIIRHLVRRETKHIINIIKGIKYYVANY